MSLESRNCAISENMELYLKAQNAKNGDSAFLSECPNSPGQASWEGAYSPAFQHAEPL